MFPDYVVFVGKPATLDYVIPTTKLLADAVAEVIGEHNVVLMSNHGVLAVAGDLKMALLRVELAEENARMLVIANSLGTPRSLTDAEVQAIYDLESEKYRQRLLRNEG
jgi:L-fuculose-phosphate aldolase